jgi:hypothetical protein
MRSPRRAATLDVYSTVSMESDLSATSGTVTEIPLPGDARALSTFSRLDYVDAFLIASDVRRTPQERIRAVLPDAPLAVQARLMSGWTALGLKLGAPGSSGRVLGWTVHRSAIDYVLLAADGRLGLNGELLLDRTAWPVVRDLRAARQSVCTTGMGCYHPHAPTRRQVTADAAARRIEVTLAQ